MANPRRESPCRMPGRPPQLLIGPTRGVGNESRAQVAGKLWDVDPGARDQSPGICDHGSVVTGAGALVRDGRPEESSTLAVLLSQLGHYVSYSKLLR